MTEIQPRRLRLDHRTTAGDHVFYLVDEDVDFGARGSALARGDWSPTSKRLNLTVEPGLPLTPLDPAPNRTRDDDALSHENVPDALAAQLIFLAWAAERVAAHSNEQAYDCDLMARLSLSRRKAQDASNERGSWEGWNGTVDELPPADHRGVAGQVMDAAWPTFGGNHQTADFWWTFNDAIVFTLAVLACAGAPAPADTQA